MKKFKRWSGDDLGGLFILAGLFIGMGIGFITNQVVGGIFIGLGIGFLAMALTRKKKK